MFLKSVEIFGFKSFAEKTKVEFTDGITALLGPNGCGKSNVVDAIKWVLGEHSSKSLRAEKMEDVIFNGTATRQKLNVAEVTLSISNETGLLGLEMPEIAVRRRLYRSGESEYFINGAPVRLKEVRELFMDTGIGKSAYSVMEQGRIAQVISNKPEERRYLFEEAAGITKYKAKRLEAERKLVNTADNMHQVENILAEVKKTHDNLKRQAEKAEKYKILLQKSTDQEIEIQLLKLKDLNENKFKKDKEIAELKTKHDNLTSTINELTDYLNEQMGTVNNMQGRMSETHRELHGIDVQKHGLDEQIRILNEQISDIDAQVAVKVQKEKSLVERQERLESDITQLNEVLGEFDTRLDGIKENIAGFQENIRSSEDKIQENNQDIADMGRRVREAESLKEDLASEIRELTGDILSLLDESLRDSGYSAIEKNDAISNIKQEIEQFKIKLKGSIQILVDGEVTAKELEATKKLLDRAKSGYEASLIDIDNLKASIEDFFELIPNFIDEFIAPEGIITRKRQIDDQIHQITRKIEDCKDRSEELSEENATLTSRIREYRSTMDELSQDQLTLEKQRTAFDSQLTNTIKERETQKFELEGLGAEIEIEREKQRHINNRISDTCHTKDTILLQEKKLKAELKSLEDEIKKNNSDLANKDKVLKKASADEHKVREQLEKHQMAMATISADIHNCYSNFRDRNSRDLSEFEDRMYEIRQPLEKIRESLAKTRQEMSSLSPVNLMAIEEYAEIKERYDMLNQQLEDLRVAKNDLNQIAEQIISESTDLFLKTFKQIQRNFNLMYRRLFGGGGADLRLSSPEDILNSGIDIYAQPPGKKLENIALLSGGEKSMTAVALLFATYQVRPAPFCILDEIDAALDEANIGRFINVLVEFAGKSQFIVITHNKKTVTGAKTLLGVTMQESGISTVISVRLGTDEDFIEQSTDPNSFDSPSFEDE